MTYKPLQLVMFISNALFGFIEIILSLRVLLKLFGASAAAPFVNWIYETSQPLLKPFSGAFPAPHLEGGFIIEFSALFALIVYAIIGYFLMELLNWSERYFKPRSQSNL